MGFSIFFFEIGFCAKIKEFRFFGLGIHCGLQNFPFFSIWFSVFVKNTCLMGYGFGFRWSFRIVPFGFRFLFDPSGHYAPPVILNSRETSVCSTCQHRIGSIRVLRTGMCTFIGFDCFACGFRFWSSFFFFCGFAVVDDFFDSFEVSNGPSHPSVQWSSTRILALQIENLSFKNYRSSLSFCSVSY